jgi:Ca2+-binding RTX toxin-like protein
MTSLNETKLNDSLLLAQQQLQGFAQDENFSPIFNSVFGTNYDRAQVEIIQQGWLGGNFSLLPEIQVLDSASMPGIQGGFSSQTGKIYINNYFLTNATLDQIEAVLLEEIGHWVDNQINISDTSGDEGELFSAFVQKRSLTQEQLTLLKVENDQVAIALGGETIVVEASSFSNTTNYDVAGFNPRSVTVGDFNGDGFQDLATANFNSNIVSVLLGNGTGGFGSATTYVVGSSPYSVTVGDFNRDGFQDLATANFNSHTVSVLLGNGTGGFGAATNYVAGTNPRSVTVGDFNRDGKLDLATANVFSNNVSVLLGNGTGGFGAATNYDVAGSSPNSVTVGDFNRDGKLDLATANYASNTVSVLLGNGTGGFGAATTFAVAGSIPSSVTVGDFNRDGFQDLATANNGSNTVSVLLGNGTGGFGAATTFAVAGNNPDSVTVGDFNRDGFQDLATANVFSNNVSVLLGNGTGGFGAATTLAAGITPISVTVGDFNRDGKQDLASANYHSNNVSILTNTTPIITVSAGSTPSEAGTDGGFTLTLDAPAPAGGATINFNLTGSSATFGTDYTLDAGFNITAVTANTFTIAAGATTATLLVKPIDDSVYDPNENVQLNLQSGSDYILGSNTTALFSPASNLAVGSNPVSVTVGDFNRDGFLDLASANFGSNNVSVLLGNGTGGFGAASTFAVAGSNPYSVTVGDFNGDGFQDLATANSGSNNVSVLLGNGTGGFGAASTFAVAGSSPISVTVGDFNRDGFLDLASANFGSNNVSVLLGNGTGGFGAASTFAVAGSLSYSVTVGDFNRDGFQDLASANANSNNVSVLLGNGTGGFGAATNYAVAGSYPVSVTVGDFNRDGFQDLASANANSNNVSVLLGNSTGGFGAATNYAVAGYSPRSVTVGDFNGDGFQDLASANYGSNNVSVLLGNGTGGFGAATTLAAGTNPFSVTVGDFNGDGKLDLASANLSSNNVSVLLNAPLNATLSIAENDTLNTPPTLSNVNKNGNEDSVISFTTTDFTSAFSDSNGDSLSKIQITSLPTNGILQLNGTVVDLNQEIAAASLDSLSFIPKTNYNGTDSFTWNGYDGTTYANTGAAVNLSVAAVDDTEFYVTNTLDSGTGSLRQAILDANTDGGIEDIIFQLDNTQQQTIYLTSGELNISDDGVNLLGLGADKLTVRRSDNASAFRIFSINSNAEVSIDGMTISNGFASGNFPTGAGGGVNNNGKLSISNSILKENSASFGGGIFNSSVGTIERITSSTISGNSGLQFGGGIFNQSSGEIKDITNSTIGNNSAITAGAGIFNQTNGKIAITSSTISTNNAYHGGGIYNEEGTIKAKNTIIAGNIASFVPDFVSTPNSTFISGGHNLIGTAITGTIASDIINPNPKLGTLQNNGGTTLTMALLPGSPAINAGDNTNPPTTDQRGSDRIFDGILDIGAYESRIAVVTGTNNNDNISSTVTNAEVIEYRALAGSDAIKATALSDYIDGGTGKDQVNYATSTAAININLATNTASGGYANNDTLIGIEGIIGSSYNDAITGSTENNIFNGGAGADTINGGGGTDSTSYATSTAAVNVNLNTGINRGGDAEFDILTSIENLIGSKFHDTLTGSNANQVISGGSGNDSITGGANQDVLDGENGNDTLLGAAGQDILTGGAGADVLDGGEGKDQINYATSRTGVNINLFASSATGGDATGDTFLNIEDLAGSAHNDTLTGDDGSNTLAGRSGNDTITARGGNDILVADPGADSLNGGDGMDTVTYSSSDIAVNVNLATGTYSGGYAQGDSLSQIENLIGSSFDDFLGGNSSNNQLEGGSGNDTLSGYNPSSFGVGEIDTLTGGLGSDRFIVGSNYNDGDSSTKGINDYVLIKDFKVSQDVVELANNLTYFLGSSPSGVVGGTSIFIDNDGTAGMSRADELVAVLQGVNLVKGQISAATPGFNFV